MKISTRGRYGLRAMVELANRENQGPVQLNVLATCQDVSPKYLHSLLIVLKDANLVRTLRGAKGGYTLVKKASDIRVNEIVKALEGDFIPVDCVANPDLCARKEQCVTRTVWQKLAVSIENTLAEYSLHDLVEKQNAGKTVENEYAI